MSERRFSPRCPNCRRLTMELATVPYDLRVAHDGRSHEIHIPDFVVPKCRECGRISIDHEAERSIDRAFLAYAHLLTPEEIESGRTAIGMSQERMAELLGVSNEEVGWWERGERHQTRLQDRVLRAFFAMPLLREFFVDRSRADAVHVAAQSAAQSA